MLKLLLLITLILCSVVTLRVELHQKKVQCLDSQNNLIGEVACDGFYSCMSIGRSLL